MLPGLCREEREDLLGLVMREEPRERAARRGRRTPAHHSVEHLGRGAVDVIACSYLATSAVSRARGRRGKYSEISEVATDDRPEAPPATAAAGQTSVAGGGMLK
jgi:hypothetical protein